MIVAEFTAQGARNRVAHDAPVRRLALIGVIDEVEKSIRLRRARLKGKCPQEAAVTCQRRDIFEERMVRNAVIMIDAEAERGERASFTCFC
jgi:hypothetical protein